MGMSLEWRSERPSITGGSSRFWAYTDAFYRALTEGVWRLCGWAKWPMHRGHGITSPAHAPLPLLQCRHPRGDRHLPFGGIQGRRGRRDDHVLVHGAGRQQRRPPGKCCLRLLSKWGSSSEQSHAEGSSSGNVSQDADSPGCCCPEGRHGTGKRRGTLSCVRERSRSKSTMRCPQRMFR